jgi:hypothetical protein
MTCFSTWTGPSIRRALSAGPRGLNARGPEKMGSAVISSSLAPRLAADRKDYPSSKVAKEKRRKANRPHQSDLTIVLCLALGCADRLVTYSFG